MFIEIFDNIANTAKNKYCVSSITNVLFGIFTLGIQTEKAIYNYKNDILNELKV